MSFKSKVQIGIVLVYVFVSISIGVKYLLLQTYTVVDGLTTHTVKTISKSVDRVVDIAGLSLSEFDQMEASNLDKKSHLVTIHRAQPLTINMGGDLKRVYTTQTKVEDILKEVGITVTELDRVTPGLKATLKVDQILVIDKIEKQSKQETQNIKAPDIYHLTTDLDPKVLVLSTPASHGQRQVSYDTFSKNKIWLSSHQVQSQELISPVAGEYQLGKEDLFVSASGSPYAIKAVYVMQATAYDLSVQSTGKDPSHPAYGITRSGTQARPGVVAVDPSLIPLGSTVYVESLDYYKDYGFSSAEDTGSAIQGRRIDLFISNHSAAMRYGRRNVRVYVLDQEIDEKLIVGYGQ